MGDEYLIRHEFLTDILRISNYLNIDKPHKQTNKHSFARLSRVNPAA